MHAFKSGARSAPPADAILLHPRYLRKKTVYRVCVYFELHLCSVSLRCAVLLDEGVPFNMDKLLAFSRSCTLETQFKHGRGLRVGVTLRHTSPRLPGLIMFGRELAGPTRWWRYAITGDHSKQDQILYASVLLHFRYHVSATDLNSKYWGYHFSTAPRDMVRPTTATQQTRTSPTSIEVFFPVDFCVCYSSYQVPGMHTSSARGGHRRTTRYLTTAKGFRK